MPNDSMKEFSITDTEAYKGLAESQGWWVCSTCGAHFPVSIPALADDGVTQCSSCVNVNIMSSLLHTQRAIIGKAVELLRAFKQVNFYCFQNRHHHVYTVPDTVDLLLNVTAFLDETSLLLMHWEKDIPHA